MAKFTAAEAKATKTSKVKGTVRCHKCQLMCRDAEHYLSHGCAERLTLPFEQRFKE